jgi:hypothetical protein
MPSIDFSVGGGECRGGFTICDLRLNHCDDFGVASATPMLIKRGAGEGNRTLVTMMANSGVKSRLQLRRPASQHVRSARDYCVAAQSRKRGKLIAQQTPVVVRVTKKGICFDSHEYICLVNAG